MNQQYKDREVIDNIVNNVGKVVIGKEKEIYNILKAILSKGHVLIEDVPGVGKTTLVKALAKSLDLSYSRIQFTPDLLPSDITGISIYNQKDMSFEFKKGPIFSNIVLADEINRTSPKTQSALLEVMEENQISEGNITYKLERPFFVLATENPIEHQGTFSLPEAQLDRFIIKISLGYPSKEAENEILNVYKNNEPLEELEAVATKEDIVNLQNKVREVNVSDELTRFMVDIAEITRKTKYLSLGVSTRGVLALQKVCQATAFLKGRSYVIPDDVKENIEIVLSHRVILSPLGNSSGYSKEAVITDLVKRLEPPKVRYNE